MRSRTVLSRCALTAGAAAGALALPAPEAPALGIAPLPAGGGDVLAPIVRVAKRPLIDRNVRLARRLAEIRGTRLKRGYRRELQRWPLTRLDHHADVLRRRLRQARTEAAASSASPALQAIAACESGGDPRAIGGGGTFRGKYQFTYATWAAVGGSGDPAAAPEAEQDRRAAMLYAQAGAGQWPVCGG